MTKKILCISIFTWSCFSVLYAQVWKDPKQPTEDRVEDLLDRLTLDEKIAYCGSVIPGIERLGIPDYEWYGEALHGIIAWNCTQFPQNIAMGATWNPELMFEVATAISNEARALKNQGKKEVMMFSPTVNMARDPRWGRNGECYSEDPFLMSEMARMYVRGMQGNDPDYTKTVTTVKHYIANNVDKNRERIQSNINEKDLYEYYFPAYKTCVVDEEATGIMTALNGLNGIPCSAHDWLVNGVLRDEWGFEGYVIADWAAVRGIETNQKYAKSQPEAAALAIKAGVDQECFRSKKSSAPMVKSLRASIESGLLTEEELDVSVRRLLRLRMMTGDFDDPSLNPYSKIPASVLESDAHKKLALKAAEQSIVLLKNDDVLPLKKDIQNLAVIGPFANRCWMGIYSGFPKSKITPLDGIRQQVTGEVQFAEGCAVTADSLDQQKISEAVALAKKSDYVVLVVGNDETTSTENVDRTSLSLPGNQHQLIKEVYAANNKVILVLVPSGPTAVTWSQENVPGIVCAWPNGQEQGTALANVLFGEVSPGGKLNATWYTSDNELPDFHDYNIQSGRTYMYYDGTPLYPFGYGLSYTSFDMSDFSLSQKSLKSKETLDVNVTVTNTGEMDGDEIVQIYLRDLKSTQKAPQKALKGFKRVSVPSGQSRVVKVSLPYEAFSYYDTLTQEYRVEKGDFEIMVGNSSDHITASKKVSVSGGVIPKIRVGEKSGYFDENDPSLQKSWDFLYENEDQQALSKAVESDDLPWVTYEMVFEDPGFYVNVWKAQVIFEKSSPTAVIETSMEGAKISSYNVDSKKALPIKIPIPPEYGKPVSLTIKTLTGDVTIKEIKIIPPGGQEPFIVDKVVSRSKKK